MNDGLSTELDEATKELLRSMEARKQVAVEARGLIEELRQELARTQLPTRRDDLKAQIETLQRLEDQVLEDDRRATDWTLAAAAIQTAKAGNRHSAAMVRTSVVLALATIGLFVATIGLIVATLAA